LSSFFLGQASPVCTFWEYPVETSENYDNLPYDLIEMKIFTLFMIQVVGVMRFIWWTTVQKAPGVPRRINLGPFDFMEVLVKRTLCHMQRLWTLAQGTRKSGPGALLSVMVFAIFPVLAEAADVTLQGSFSADDNIQLFSVSVATPGEVDFRSFGYAGGTTSTGVIVPRGGFDTILTLFSGSGVFIDDNDEGSGVATDPTTGLAADARLTETLSPGEYILALTEFDNFSLGNLSDGFAETGNPNFTADPNFATGGACPGDMFRDISGSAGRCRTGDWTVDFVDIQSAEAVPEPATDGLLALSLISLAWGLRKRKHHAVKLLSLAGVLTVLGAGTTYAQQSNPDYSQVPDILYGRRTVVQATDLEVVALDPNVGPVFAQINTANSQQTASNFFNWGLQGIDASKPVLNFSAHMFNQPSTSTITTLHNFNNAFGIWIQDLANSNGSSVWLPLAAGDEPVVNCGVAADFTGDGYDDFAVGFGDGRVLVVSPVSTDPAQQPFSGSFRSNTPLPTVSALQAMAAGDFNGDGTQKVAALTTLSGTGQLELVVYKVDPRTLALTQVSSLVLNNASTSNTHVSMARGRFNTLSYDQLVVAFATDTNRPIAEIIDFDANMNPREGPPGVPTTPNISIGSTGFIQVQTGHFALPNSPYDQVVYNNASSNSAGGSRFFETLTVNSSDLGLGGTSPIHYDNQPYPSRINVGNFDHRQPDPTNPQQNELNPNNQIAFMFYNSSGEYTMDIYSVNPDTSNLSVNSTPDSGTTVAYGPISATTPISFVSTDLQGRSYILGPPAKIVVNGSIQPSVVLATPPMHVDWVTPVNGTAPVLLDVSASPNGFQTSYQVDTSTTDESETSDTTSFSFGAKVSAGASLSIGDVDEGEGLQVKDVYTATQDLKKTVQNESGTTRQNTYGLKASTIAGDYVLYTESRFNIWVYPVIGQSVCPATKPGCAATDKVPLTIQFSIPDQTADSSSGSGINMEWYQPPWEPFNVLSYPANLSQLKLIYPNLAEIASTGESFTDQGQLSQQVTWTSGSTSSQTAGFDENNSFENDLSVTAAVSFGEVGVGFEGSLDLSGSSSLSQLNKSTTTYSSSTGIGVASTGSFLDPSNYRYPLTPVIFASKPPDQTAAVDRSPLSTQVQAYGLIRSAFTADPARGGVNGAGGWWSQAYNLPDVALNRPAHLQLATPEAGDVNCLSWGTGASQIDCFGPGTFAPNTPFTSEFHFMRGFFISNAAHPGQGPQLTMARAGDQLALQARVYDYSFVPITTTVHVDFYAQPIDSHNVPDGPSFFINEATLQQGIPGFSDVDGAPLNWSLATVNFDTTAYSGQTLAFWVLVWMEPDATGKVTEMPGHGLTAIPTNFKNFTSLADVPTEAWSNNVGLYKLAFSILPPLGAGGSPESQPVPVDIGKIQLSATRGRLNEPIIVAAPLSVASSAALGVSARFYVGDPDKGGKLFDVETMPYLEANQGRDATVIYRPSTCGTHELFVVVNKGLGDEVKRRSQPIRVRCGELQDEDR
jgi:hypothetical protein